MRISRKERGDAEAWRRRAIRSRSVSLDALTTQLTECEAIIERGLASFLEMGQALLRIRDGRLYRRTHRTFAHYCQERWSLSRSYAYELMEAGQVAEALSGIADVPNASIALELAALKDDPASMQDVWRSILEEGKPTAARVRERVDAILCPPEQDADWAQLRSDERANGTWQRRRRPEAEQTHPDTPAGNAARKAEGLIAKALSTDSVEESHACIDKACQLISEHDLKPTVMVNA
jgi:hypothetical protein